MDTCWEISRGRGALNLWCFDLNHDRINLNLVGAPNCRGPLVLELTLTTVRYATDDVAGCDKKYLIIITKKRRSICIVFLIHRTPSIKFHPQSWIWIKRLRYNFDITSTDWILETISHNRCSIGVCSKNLLRKRKLKYFIWLLWKAVTSYYSTTGAGCSKAG